MGQRGKEAKNSYYRGQLIYGASDGCSPAPTQRTVLGKSA